MVAARERQPEAPRDPAAAAPARRGLPLVVGACVLLVELAWLAGLAYLVWLVVSLL